LALVLLLLFYLNEKKPRTIADAGPRVKRAG